MKILRSVTRRGFKVDSAGYFSVLRPNSWFPASRLQDDPYHLSGGPKPTAEYGSQNPATPSLSVNWRRGGRGSIRLVVAILAGIAITLALLWWIMVEAGATLYLRAM